MAKNQAGEKDQMKEGRLCLLVYEKKNGFGIPLKKNEGRVLYRLKSTENLRFKKTLSAKSPPSCLARHFILHRYFSSL